MKKIFITLLILIAGHICFAENSVQKINLSEAVNLAIKNNIDFQANKLDTEIAKNNIKVANKLQNPDFDIFYNFGSAGKGNPQLFGMTETIEIAKRGARKKLAKANYELAKENLYLVPLKMGLRFAVCAVEESKCKKAPAIIKEVLDRI